MHYAFAEIRQQVSHKICKKIMAKLYNPFFFKTNGFKSQNDKNLSTRKFKNNNWRLFMKIIGAFSSPRRFELVSYVMEKKIATDYNPDYFWNLEFHDTTTSVAITLRTLMTCNCSQLNG